MTLSEQQRLFAKQLPKLINKAHALGFEVTLGDAYRDARVFGDVGEKKGYGKSFSLHKSRLAIDLNLFKNGKYLTKTSDHKPLGEWWEAQHPMNFWGGRIDDGNHYSMSWDGRG